MFDVKINSSSGPVSLCSCNVIGCLISVRYRSANSFNLDDFINTILIFIKFTLFIQCQDIVLPL